MTFHLVWPTASASRPCGQLTCLSPFHFHPWYYLHVHSVHTIKALGITTWDYFACQKHQSPENANIIINTVPQTRSYQLCSGTMYSMTLIIRASIVWTLQWCKHSASVHAQMCMFTRNLGYLNSRLAECFAWSQLVWIIEVVLHYIHWCTKLTSGAPSDPVLIYTAILYTVVKNKIMHT